MPWKRLTKEVFKKIMNTDIYIEVQFRDESETTVRRHIEEAFSLLRAFEKNYSRFRTNNELWRLNTSTHTSVSAQLFDLLLQARHFFEFTHGVFDPTVLTVLEQTGYRGAYKRRTRTLGKRSTMDDIILNPKDRTVTKPLETLIDLGGIGKGYAVDMIASFLHQHYENFLIDAGGDMFACGENQVDGQLWGIDIENPFTGAGAASRLLLSGVAVATSGSNRRRWLHEGKAHHHLINAQKQQSSTSDLLTVTVVSSTATEADVLAKTLFLLSREKALRFCKEHRLAALCVTQEGELMATPALKKFVWNPAVSINA